MKAGGVLYGQEPSLAHVVLLNIIIVSQPRRLSMRIRNWNDLNSTEREQIQLMLVSLKEFCYGFDRLESIAGELEPGVATIRFYFNSLYQYVGNYYLVGGANKLINVLENIGSGDLLRPITELLDIPLGSTTFGQIVRSFRDKFLTHQSFVFRTLEREVHDRFDILDPANAELFAGLVQQLFSRTKELYVNISERFPEALCV